MDSNIILLDIGGTWLKGSVVEFNQLERFAKEGIPFSASRSAKVESRLSPTATCSDFILAIKELVELLEVANSNISAIGVSTAGVVDYAGKFMRFTSPHLKAIVSKEWSEYLETTFNAPVIIANDADAVMFAAAKLNYLQGEKSYGIMPIGTGLGFCVLRNGRRWTPNFSYTLLGAVETPNGCYDEIASIVGLFKKYAPVTPKELFTDAQYSNVVEDYINNLVKIIQSSYYLYGVQEILLGGGLADFAMSIDFPLVERLNEKLSNQPLYDGTIPNVVLLNEGNKLAILGVGLLAYGEAISRKLTDVKVSKVTERPYDSSLRLHEYNSKKIVDLLWNAEQKAGEALGCSLDKIASVVDEIVKRLKSGGRIIYVGAGTSGRLAAIDTVEIGCTFGFPRERVLSFVAGGIADASIDIETRFEEDASSLPDLISANLSANDVVIGISVSGSAYYAQSALAYAKEIGAYSVMIQEADEELRFCNSVIALRSGSEIISGSTRMKAGTATKKTINFISTASMIQLGRVHSYYMVELECTNVKLKDRAKRILVELFNLPESEAISRLEQSNFILKDAIAKLS